MGTSLSLDARDCCRADFRCFAGALSPMSLDEAGVLDEHSVDRLGQVLATVLEPMLSPVLQGVHNLHLELLRQMHIYKRDVTAKLDAFQQQNAALTNDLQELRRENERLKRLRGL